MRVCFLPQRKPHCFSDLTWPWPRSSLSCLFRISFMRAPSSWPNYPPKVPLPNTITLGYMCFNIRTSGETSIEFPAYYYSHVIEGKSETPRCQVIFNFLKDTQLSLLRISPNTTLYCFPLKYMWFWNPCSLLYFSLSYILIHLSIYYSYSMAIWQCLNFYTIVNITTW